MQSRRSWISIAALTWALSAAFMSAYSFYQSTKPYPGDYLGIEGWDHDPVVLQAVLVVMLVAFIGLPLPLLAAGAWRLRQRRSAMVMWVSGWVPLGLVGLLMNPWLSYPVHSCHITGSVADPTQCLAGSPAVIQWPALALALAFIAVGVGVWKWLARVTNSGTPQFSH